MFYTEADMREMERVSDVALAIWFKSMQDEELGGGRPRLAGEEINFKPNPQV